jgi:mRNA deadenylase 3'-5' endonuclease subunit Ccr4
MRKFYPLVNVLAPDKSLATVQVTQCDWCGKHLRTFDNIADNAIRVLYFCTQRCKREFDAKYPANTHIYPPVKLTLLGLNLPLKDCIL